MDAYSLLNKHSLSRLWIADPRKHGVIAASSALITLGLDLLLGGRNNILRVMRQLKRSSATSTPGSDDLRFSYLYHYYSNRTVYNYGWLLYSPSSSIREAMERAQILGLKNLQEALQTGQGVIAFSAHVGCFFNPFFCRAIVELVGDRKVMLLSPANLEERKRLLKDQIRKVSPSLHFDLIDITIPATGIKIYRTLKEGGLVGCTLDYAYPYTRNKVVTFFGRRVDFPVGAIEMGRKIGATYLPFFCYIKNGQLTLEFQKPFMAIKTRNTEEDIDVITRKVNDVLEQKIMALPEQWNFWLRLYYSRPT